MAGLTEHPNLKTSFADNSPFTEELIAKGLNSPNTAINNIATELGNNAKGAALEAPASSASAVVNLLGQLKQAIKNIKGTGSWHTGAASTIAAIYAKFHASTGHAHSGGANDAPKITAGGLATSAVETARINALAVTTAKINALAITAAKLATDAVETAKIKNLNVTTDKLAALAVTAAKIEAQEGWTEVNYQNSWVAYSASYQGFHYMKDSLGFVHLTGLVKDGSPVTSVMATLPVGYRPVLAALFPSVTNSNVFCRISITSGGNVSGTSPISASWASLHGITFKAA